MHAVRLLKLIVMLSYKRTLLQLRYVPFDACGSVIEAHSHVIVQKNSATVKVWLPAQESDFSRISRRFLPQSLFPGKINPCKVHMSLVGRWVDRS